MEKTEFLRALLDLTDKLVHPKTSQEGLNHIQKEELRSLQERGEKLGNLILMHRKIEEIKAECTLRRGETKKKVQRILDTRRQVEKIKDLDVTAGLINKKNSLAFTSEEVIPYACKFSNFCQAPPRYRAKDTYLPFSFGPNKVEIEDMELSAVYYMYKNNPQYKRANPPRVVYLKGSDANIQETKQMSAAEIQIVARDSLTIGFQKDSGDDVVYTMNSREPSKYEFKERLPELIFINGDKTLKAKAFRPGVIDSEIVTFHFRILDPTNIKQDLNGLDGLIRPRDGIADNSEDFGAYDDLFGGDDVFGSVHLQGGYSTPGH